MEKLEQEIFKRTKVNIEKLIDYGFKKEKDNYIYETNFLNDDFKAQITIDKKGNVHGKIIDLQINEEYLALRTETRGDFTNKIREIYKEILNNIKENCYEEKEFINEQTNRISKYIKEKYQTNPEFLWERTPGCGVFRKNETKKWFGIIMNINISKIDKGNKEIEIINVKLDEKEIQELLNKKGYYKAYHMNKKNWITIILDDTLKDEYIEKLIDKSYKNS